MRPLAALLILIPLANPAQAADAAHPTVVELFQSQGCSSCPPANANLLAIAERPEILALSWQVTYWDYLGWRDTFARNAFTQRQYDYARTLGHDAVFTPQFVINGRADGPGTTPEALQTLIDTADRGATGPTISLTTTEARLGPSTTSADILLVRYDPNLVQVPIHSGENAGQTLPHRNIVVQLVNLGRYAGAAQAIILPDAPRLGLRTAILLQVSGTGEIIAASSK